MNQVKFPLEKRTPVLHKITESERIRMLEKIKQIFTNAIVQETPVNHPEYFCFFEDLSKSYIAIPKEDLSEREKMLLESFFTWIEPSSTPLNYSTVEQNWFHYLTGDGNLPATDGRRIRHIHFYIREKFNRENFREALKSFFQDHLVIVWLSENNGVMIEKETAEILLPDDFLSLTEAVLSDFYFSVDFYMGRFYEPSDSLKEHFLREQHYFYLSKKILPQRRIFTFETAFPLFVMSIEGKELVPVLQAEWENLFQNDRELLETIKLYLENNLNTSLTAKKLYLHRNSLQYRIDKFVERTSIDIREFKGAVSVYFICLFAEAFLSD